jgi:hypothetical protein
MTGVFPRLSRASHPHVQSYGLMRIVAEATVRWRSSLWSLSITEDSSLLRPSSLIDAPHARALRADLATSRLR